ncbi:MAG: hypothetical protein WA220_11710 [Candidatus Nitrosopolaris sp.]|jgi:hypothetical protein
MNFVETEAPLNGIAKMFVCKEENMKEVTHSLLDSYIVFVLISKQ